jgi:hypothetical protein
MKNMLGAFYTKPLVAYLVMALIVMSALAGPAEAMFLPASPEAPSTPLFDRAADLARIQKSLESKTVRQRLIDYGLTADEAMAKLEGLPDDQVHQLAANADALQAGGDAAGTLAALLLIALLVILLIYLLEGRIEVRRR